MPRLFASVLLTLLLSGCTVIRFAGYNPFRTIHVINPSETEIVVEFSYLQGVGKGKITTYNVKPNGRATITTSPEVESNSEEYAKIGPIIKVRSTNSEVYIFCGKFTWKELDGLKNKVVIVAGYNNCGE